jgi:bifunctional DNA-binding transcriptional regulator/antitoxin component of YhaV-PrlF toxin-antitoxin module
MVRVVVNNGQYKVTIPKDLAESKGWGKGTKLLIIEDDKGNIMLKEIIKDDHKKNR